nr:hypothetical protein [uncultured Sphingobacterium sp.]
MKLNYFYSLIVFFFLVHGTVKAQRLVPGPEIPLYADIEFEDLLSITGVSSMPTTADEIIRFKQVFAPALQVIENVSFEVANLPSGSFFLRKYILESGLENTLKATMLDGNLLGMEYLNIFIKRYYASRIANPYNWTEAGYIIGEGVLLPFSPPTLTDPPILIEL